MTEENSELSAVEAETPAKAATPETEVTQEEPAKAPEAKPSEAEEAEAASEAAKLLAQRKQSARERVQQAVARQREAERQSAAKDAIIAELRSKLKEPDPAQYDDNAKYTADVLDFKMNQRDLQTFEREKKEAVETSREAIAEAWTARVNDFKPNAKDFEAVAYSAPISEPTALLVAEMEEGPAIAYELGKNHAEARRIDRLPERLKAVELGKIAARISTPAPVKTTKAPEPISPVGGRGAPKTKNPDDMTTEEWMRWDAEQAKAKGRRY